jgi:hypothetical protein
MRYLQLSLSLVSALAGFVAAYQWYLASKEYDAPDIDLDDPLGESIACSGAIKVGQWQTAARNKKAALWTAAFIGFSAVSVLVSSLWR